MGAWAAAAVGVALSPRAGYAQSADAAPTGDAGVGAAAPAAGPGRVEPPVIARQAAPVYPRGVDGRRVDVELLLTIDERGAVTSAEVLGHIPADAPDAFEQSARAAALAMQFAPARRDGEPLAVRVRFHMVVAPPLISLGDGGAHAPPEVGELGTGAEGVAHAPTEPRAAQAVRRSDPAPPPAPSHAAPAGVTVRASHAPAESRGAGDFYTVVNGLRQVPRANASDLLRLAAPGILLTNEGGEGHAEQVYLRGFDAHEGQDLEFTVNGVPINEAGNPHGEGLVNTHFILPELVRAIRVLEGPFDPRQGNYAVAGSAEYELGLERRGLVLQYTGGSFNTHRVLALWGPAGASAGTFAGADVRTTDGFGTNRAARLGRAMVQWEQPLGATTVLRLLGAAYATEYGTAGVVRQDDFAAGRIGFFGSYDPTQGGTVTRFVAAATLEDARPARVLRQQLFAIARGMRLRANYTGFVEDPPEMFRSGTAQRGDAVDQSDAGVTVGARGSARLRAMWRGLSQAIEAGFYGRYDRAEAAQRRLRFGSVVPYRVDFDLVQSIANVGVYVDAELRPWRWLVVRGGVRADFFSFDVLSRCDLHDTVISAAVRVLDELCYDRDRAGPRDPTARRTANGLAVQPRAAVLLGPFADVTLTASAGTGARAADPSYLADTSFAPFASVLAAEGGAIWNRRFGATLVTARALYYFTYVDRDLIFNQQAGRNTLAPGTRRQGVVVAARLTNGWLDWAASATYADARFVREAMDPGTTFFPVDQGEAVPYVPSFVARSDTALHGAMPFWRLGGAPLVGRVGLGITYVSPRTLPYGERSEPMLVLDLAASARWRVVELGFIAQNLLDLRYRLNEFYYVSNFQPDAAAPSMLPQRHFVAGPPLGVFGTLTFYFGDGAATGSG